MSQEDNQAITVEVVQPKPQPELSPIKETYPQCLTTVRKYTEDGTRFVETTVTTVLGPSRREVDVTVRREETWAGILIHVVVGLVVFWFFMQAIGWL